MTSLLRLSCGGGPSSTSSTRRTPGNESGDHDVHPAAIHQVRQGDQVIWTMDGGMTLGENLRIAFDYRVNGAGRRRVRAEDPRHAVWEQSFPIGSSS